PIIPIVCLALMSVPVYGFKPDDTGHLLITSIALRRGDVSRTIGSVNYAFTDKAIEEVRDANKSTDLSLSFFDSAAHFDDEDFAGGTQRLIDLKSRIIEKITAAVPDGVGARQELGGALHTVQDFYSHSSWVELGNTTIIDSRL